MKGLSAALFLSICLLLRNPVLASDSNNEPCQPSKYNNGHNTFLHRHVRAGTPKTLDQNAWEKYLRDHKDCERPTQSFLHASDEKRVDAVCSSNGGKKFSGNLCISRRPFTYITVRSSPGSSPGTCSVTSVRNETKHLILACDVLENRCLPVHFEGNPKGLEPDKNAQACGNGTSFKMTGIRLSLGIVLMFFFQQFL